MTKFTRAYQTVGAILCTLTFSGTLVADSDGIANFGENMLPPSTRETVDRFGVDMTDGTFGAGGMYVRIGGKDSGIERNPGRQRYLHDNHTGTLTQITLDVIHANNPEELRGLPIGTYIKVDTQGESEWFRVNGSSYTNHKQTGGSLSCSSQTCTYTMRNATEVIFDRTITNGVGRSYPKTPYLSPPHYNVKYTNVGLHTKVIRPDGEELSYYYRARSSSNPNGPANPSAAVSSLGWMIKYHFGPKDMTESGNIFTSETTRSVMAVNTATEYCDPLASECIGLQNTWPISSLEATQRITYPSAQHSEYTITASSDVTDALGNNDSYRHSTGSHCQATTDQTYTTPEGISTTYYSPGAAYAAGTCYPTPMAGKIVSVRFGGDNYYYEYHPQANGPDGTYVSTLSTRRLLYFIDNLNRRTSYEYTQWGTDIKKIIHPDATPSSDTSDVTGGYTEYVYGNGGRRNLKEIREHPKGGGPAMVTRATYTASCTSSNRKFCNKPLTITTPDGITTTYTYHAQSGNVATVTRPAVNGSRPQTRYTYRQITPRTRNSSGNLVNSVPVWRLAEISTCMTGDADACVGTTNELKSVITYNHNNVLPTTRTVMLGDGSITQTTTYDYDIYGRVRWEQGPRGSVHDRTYYYYDLLHRLIAEVGPDPDGSGPVQRTATRYSYNKDGSVTSVRTGVVSSTSLSAVNAMQVLEEVATEYSSSTGFPIAERYYADGSLKKVVQKSYDDRLRLECSALRMNPASFQSLPASACALAPAGPYGNDRITRYIYDDADALVSTISGYGTPRQRADITNHYRADNGILEAVEDGNGNITRYEYDAYRRLTKTIFPQKSNGSVPNQNDYIRLTYIGDSAQIATKRLRNGGVISYAYDPLGRIEQKSGAVIESFKYDNFDNIVEKTNNTSHTSSNGTQYRSLYDYNALHWRLAEQRYSGSTNLGKVEYQYNNFGQRTRLTWPDGFYVTYDYHSVGGYPSHLLNTIYERLNDAELATYQYDTRGRVARVIRGASNRTDYEYDGFSRLNEIATVFGSSNSPDNITETFTHNPAGQIYSRRLEIQRPDYQWLPTSNGTISYSANGLNQITHVGGSSVSYDNRGNLTNRAGKTYSYNNNNRLTRVVQPSGTSNLHYDAENRLASLSSTGQNTIRFVYDGTDLIAETNTSGTVLRRYVHGPGADDPIVWYEGSGTGNKRYLTANAQGSVVSVSNQSSSVLSINAYDEYGAPAGGNQGRFQYTGQVWLPEVGLYYYKARMYDPYIGRFMQTDPIGYADQMNLYAYVHNDPLNYTDPDGRMSIRVISRPNASAGLDVHYRLHNRRTDIFRAPATKFLGRRFESVKNAIDNVLKLEGKLDLVPDAVGPLDSASMRRVVALDRALTPHLSSLESNRKRGLLPSPDQFRDALNGALEATGLADEFKELYGGTVDDFVGQALENQSRSNDPSVRSNSENGMSGGIVKICSGMGAQRGGC